MIKYASKFFQKYVPENDLEKNVSKDNPAPTNIGRSKDVDDSISRQPQSSNYWETDVIIIPLNSNKLSLS